MTAKRQLLSNKVRKSISFNNNNNYISVVCYSQVTNSRQENCLQDLSFEAKTCLALPWSCPSIRRRCCAIYFLWLQRWLRRPKSDAHTLLQMWQHRQLAVVMTVACLRVQQSSAAWLDSIMNKSRPALHVSRCVDLSAARDSSWSVGMWHFFSEAKTKELFNSMNAWSSLKPFMKGRHSFLSVRPLTIWPTFKTVDNNITHCV